MTRRQRRSQVTAEINLGDVIDANPAGDVENPGGNVLGTIVDDVRSAAGTGSLGLFRGTDGGNHRRSGPARQLHRIMADSTGTASDK